MMTIYNKAVHSKVKTCAAVAFATCNINKYRRAFGNIDIERVSAVTRHRIPCIHIDGENIHAFIIAVKRNISVCTVIYSVCL